MHPDEDEETGTRPHRGVFVALADVDDLEKEMISTRTLALTRFQRNHEFMDEVFMQAALGSSIRLTHSCIRTHPFCNPGDKHPPKRKSPWSMFEVSELESKTVRTKLLLSKICAHTFTLGQTDCRDRRTPEAGRREEIPTVCSCEW